MSEPISEEEFEAAFQELLDDATIDQMLSVPGVEGLIREDWSNAIIARAEEMREEDNASSD